MPSLVGLSTPHERALLGLILALGAALRLWLLLGPFSEIDADEAIVGLMALQIPGELPAFYWEQHYLGTLEAFAAAGLFALFGPSAAAMKAVPAAFSLAFVALVYVAARPVFGAGPALLAALYLAVPPSFFAAWSVKARGGYAEALALGQLFLATARRFGDGDSGRSWRLAGLAGLAAGLALWTHPLAVVMVAAGGVYVALAWRPWLPERRAARATWAAIGAAALGCVVGLAPALAHNLTHDFASLRFAAEGGTEPRAALLNVWGLVRYGLPVIVGLAEATPSRELLLADWPTRPGSAWLVTAALPLLGIALVWWYRAALAALVRGRGTVRRRGPALFLLVLLLVPPFVAVSRFANLWAEPRYALPIYAAVPLVTALVWRARAWSRAGAALVAAGLLALNVYSLSASDYRLGLPTSAGPSTAASRAILIAYLDARGIDRVYTDYWLAYPIAFESRERIVPAVWSGGFSRRGSYSHLVAVAPNPAFVFARETPGDLEFRRRLAELGGSAEVAEVSVYRVYTSAEPLDALRRP